MTSNEDDDFDDFGDFEEAQQVEEDVNLVDSAPFEEPPPAVKTETLESFTHSIDVNLLSDLLNDQELWNVDPTLINDQSDINLFDLFSHFYSCTDNSAASENLSRAIELWQFLHVVEETNALKFRWPSSQLYSHFIEALSFCGSQQSTSSGICVPKAAGFLASGEFSVNKPIEETGELELASSEWTLPDYSNNANSAVDCDFFQSDFRDNGLSVLEQELNALGLSAPKNKPPQPVVNGTSHKPKQTDDHAPRYLSVSELNDEAQTFYEHMPDFSFLLVDRVLRDN